MDIQAIIDKVVSEAQNAPEIVQELMADPGAAIEKVTGHSLGETDIAAVAEGVLAQCRKRAATSSTSSAACWATSSAAKSNTFPVCTMGSVRGSVRAPFFVPRRKASPFFLG